MRFPHALALALALGVTPVLTVAPGMAFAQATQPATPAAPKIPPAVVATPPAATVPAVKAVPVTPVAAPAGKVELLDINSASAAELEGLHGIGKVRADAIIKSRPYKGKDELVQKNIIPQGIYDGVKEKIIAKQK